MMDRKAAERRQLQEQRNVFDLKTLLVAKITYCRGQGKVFPLQARCGPEGG